jgi:hypothetical protein
MWLAGKGAGMEAVHPGARVADDGERYLKTAQTDLQKAHQDASPVMNWLL